MVQGEIHHYALNGFSLESIERTAVTNKKPIVLLVDDQPVIFVTAVAHKDTVTKCLLLYPQGYLIKPLTKSELLDVVNNFFSRR